MPKIEKFDLQLVDFFTDKVIRTEPAYKASDDQGNVVVFCKNVVLDDIDKFEKDYSNSTDEELKECGFNAKPSKIKAQCDIMRTIVNNLDDESMIKIVECLPHLKNGSIRSTTLPVYMTGITNYDGDTYWCRISSIELSVEPWVIPAPLTSDPKSIFAPSTKIKNTFIFTFNKHREYNKKDVPVINQDLTYNQVTYQRNSYIPIEDLIPGCVYMDAKDREFLYLGTIGRGSTIDYVDGKTNRPNGSMTDKKTHIKPDLEEVPYVFLSLNDKRKKELQNVNTFGEWMEQCITKLTSKPHGENYPVYYYECNYLKMASSFKVVEEVEKLFDKKDMYCDLDIIVGEDLTTADVAARGIDYALTKVRTHFAVINKKPVWEYTVHEWNHKANSLDDKDILKTLDKKEASKFTKEYLKDHPDRRPEKEYDWWNNKTGIFVGMTQEIIALDLNKKENNHGTDTNQEQPISVKA